MDASIKSLTITGTAIADARRSRQKALGTRKRNIREEDDIVEPEKPPQAVSVSLKPVVPVKTINLVTPTIQPIIEAKPNKPVEPPSQTVLLNPPRQQRVRLQPKVVTPINPVPLHSDNTTRKARRIKLSVSTLSHRFTRAKKLRDESENSTISSIREYLIKKGVIQEKSKAPEKMLRSMYSDFRILKEEHAL